MLKTGFRVNFLGTGVGLNQEASSPARKKRRWPEGPEEGGGRAGRVRIK